MRTREEQISQLSCAIFNKRPGDIDECIALARKYILEAEHRAEQRVRAEIEANLKDPSTVHVNMLRGSIATPTWEQFLHLFPKKITEIGRDSERLDWISSTLAEMRLIVATRRRFVSTVTLSGPVPASHFRMSIDAAREVKK